MRPYVSYSQSYFPDLHASGTAREFTVAGIVSPNSPKLLAEKRFEIRAEDPPFSWRTGTAKPVRFDS